MWCCYIFALKEHLLGLILFLKQLVICWFSTSVQSRQTQSVFFFSRRTLCKLLSPSSLPPIGLGVWQHDSTPWDACNHRRVVLICLAKMYNDFASLRISWVIILRLSSYVTDGKAISCLKPKLHMPESLLFSPHFQIAWFSCICIVYVLVRTLSPELPLECQVSSASGVC